MNRYIVIGFRVFGGTLVPKLDNKRPVTVYIVKSGDSLPDRQWARDRRSAKHCG